MSNFTTIDVTRQFKLHSGQTGVEIVLLAVMLISPVGVAALFAFARFADRNFRDGALPAQKRFMDVVKRSRPRDRPQHAG
ncbi:hypothetical protein QCE63_28565 [Caballeronia sp. LZ065]|uniref:hypothetical protein n=1 Tax=Caballeronia sp. LZ065 TaxID=3038571 RepID=UPI00285F024A|nr:hypothetical protein [Caballeronia sp. LZ065]MDR5783370.1 hypothetical protein [Caballeronia sp. LZ065]